ncbi:hypothetical protein NW759_017472 [Fusarium solani]|nr:hypothetical protein NW759_017472 [Fusarium solani]
MSRSYAKSWLEVEETMGVRPVLRGNAEETRGQFDGLISMLEPQYPAPSTTVRTEDGTIDAIKYRIFTPAAANQGISLPLGVYYHPGGFVIGKSFTDDVLCRTIAEKTGSIVVSVEYRLAPEHKAPAQLEDALKALEWAYDNATQLGGDSKKIYTIGTSAGAGLALCVARKVALGQSQVSPDVIKGVVALAPYTLHNRYIPEAYRSTHQSYVENRDGVPMIDLASLDAFFDDASLDPKDEDYFAALDQDHHKLLPPTYVATCEIDPLRDDGKVLAESLKTSGVSVKTDHYDGLPHCFWVFPGLPESQRFMENTVNGVKWILSKM